MTRLPNETINLKLEFEARLQKLRSDCLVSGDSLRVRALVQTVEQWLAFLRHTAAHDPLLISPDEAVAVGLRWANALIELSVAAPGLEEEATESIIGLIDTLPKHVPGMEKYRFTWNWVFENDAQWRIDLGHFAGKPHLSFLELGSLEGRATCWLLDNILTHETSRITCLDWFRPPYAARFDHNVGLTAGLGRVRKMPGNIRQTLRTLPLAHFDFIYVDASSAEHEQLEDAIVSWSLLKEGGIITFDDYGGPSDWEPGVTKGTNSFLAAFTGHYEELYRGFQLTLKKLSVK